MLLPSDELNDIVTHIPNVILDVRYATKHNITGNQLYVHQIAWLRHEPLDALVRAAEEFNSDGFNIVVFDAFRPLSVQRKLREVCSDSDYVLEHSNHCRGITVDLTLADSRGIYLDMGTDYDDFSEKSHPGSKSVTAEQALNRELLSKVMTANGFIQHPNEWWHFDYRPESDWEVIEDESNSLVAG